MKKNILISIEHKARDLNSNIYLAKYLLEKNFRVYIGNRLSLERLIKLNNKKFSLIYKGGLDNFFLNLIKNKCVSLIILDQEAGPSVIKKNNLKFRVNYQNREILDRYYVLNSERYAQAKKELKFKKKNVIQNYGWPRVDLWKNKNYRIFENEIAKIKKENIDFFLYISNFRHTYKNFNEGFSDYINHNKKIFEQFKFSKKIKDRKLKELKKNAKTRRKEFFYIINFLKKLSNITKKKIIIRPHYTDDISGWLYYTKNIENVKIANMNYDLQSYILACDYFLHSGDASVYQATLSKKKIGIITNNLKRNAKYLKFSYNLSDLKKLKKFSINSLKLKSSTIKEAKKHLFSKKIDASERIAKDINLLNNFNESPLDLFLIDKLYFYLQDFFYRIKNFITSGTKSKIPGYIDTNYVIEFLNKTNCKKKFQVRRIINNLIEIS